MKNKNSPNCLQGYYRVSLGEFNNNFYMMYLGLTLRLIFII